jgi:hypothetical protein
LIEADKKITAHRMTRLNFALPGCFN